MRDVRKILGRKTPRKAKSKGRLSITWKLVNYKVNKEHVITIKFYKKDEFYIFCLGKYQQTSSAVIFARLKSNRRYKPGD